MRTQHTNHDDVQVVSPHVSFLVGLHCRGTLPLSTVKCTYTTIPQAATTWASILSKPQWMWGAGNEACLAWGVCTFGGCCAVTHTRMPWFTEMGVNEWGVVVGNEALFCNVKPNTKPNSGHLLGTASPPLHCTHSCCTLAHAIHIHCHWHSGGAPHEQAWTWCALPLSEVVQRWRHCESLCSCWRRTARCDPANCCAIHQLCCSLSCCTISPS